MRVVVPTIKEDEVSQSRSPHAVAVEGVASTLIKACDTLESKIDRIDSGAERSIKRIRQKAAKRTEPLKNELADLRGQLNSHLTRHRPTFRRHWGRTVKLPNGIVKWHIIPRSLQTPKDVKHIIQALLRMRGGKKYLSVEYSLDRRALAAAPPRLLRRLGMSNSRQEQLTVMPTKADGTPKREKPTELSRKRYPAPRRTKD